jgi:arylsulfatase A-like enzyme
VNVRDLGRGAAAPTFVLALALGAGALAWKSGGGAEVAAPPPRPEAPAAPASASRAGAPSATASAIAAAPGGATASAASATWEVAVRLVDAAADARVDGNLASASRALALHWRKMRPAFVHLEGDAARWVTSIALRTSAMETQWAMPSSKPGKQWTPDARVWNMNEGSFDQREALVAPAPTTFSYRVTIPQGGKLVFAEGTVNATRDTTVFVVSVVDAKGQTHEVLRDRLPPARARVWTEQSADLAAFTGQTVELRLATETSPPTAEEAKLVPRVPPAQKKRRDAEGGDAAKDGTTTSTTSTTSAGPAAGGDAQADEALGIPSSPVALWANPTLLARTPPRLPYNVLWIVVDALRPDVLASFHDDAEDAQKRAAEVSPLEAWLPKVPGLMPVLDELSTRGVRFTKAYSGGAWTRPGTISMLAGMRSSELGVDTMSWVLQAPDVARFYASEPPLLPLLLRQRGAVSAAFVNNYFMVGYARVGVEMGFERAADHRFRTRDTLEVTSDATRFLRQNKDTRFFAFVNYNSPHEPYEPPKELEARVPAPPAGPSDPITRLYMAEAAKDDEAIGVLLRTLEETGNKERTIVVVTADHGETLSKAHAGTSGLDKMPVRYHHAVSNYEETTRIPILVVAPGLLPAGRDVKARVRNVDLAPTILELLGVEANPRMTGASLVALARGGTEPEERVVVSEGRGTRGILYGHHRLLVREGAAKTTYLGDKAVTVNEELYDLDVDPGERKDLAPSSPQLVLEMRARLAAALAHAPVAGSAGSAGSAGGMATSAGAAKPPVEAQTGAPVVHVRFASGGRSRRISGTMTAGDARLPTKSIEVVPVELGRETFKVAGNKVDLAFTTSASTVVGFDVVLDPPTAALAWDVYMDERPWGADQVFGGPFGILAPLLRSGLMSDEARLAAQAPLLPPIDPRRDVGLFVVRERRGETKESPADADEGAEEMARLLREWGYAQGPRGASGP